MRTLLFSIACLLLAATAGADGTFFRTRSNNFSVGEARPTIPFQRAVVKFDGQEEIMLVESVLNGPTGTYGWVVPLPTRPSYVKAVDPMYTSQSFTAVKPPVKTEKPAGLEALGLGALLLAAVALTSGLRYRNRPLASRIMFFSSEVVGLAVVGMVLLPMFSPNRSAGMYFAEAGKGGDAAAAKSSRGLNVESLGTIGSYDVSVVSGESGKEILGWLDEHKLDVGKNALPVIEQYAKEGWCFLAAEIRKGEPGSHPPHPLKAVFPTDKVVYPMRLTGTQDAPLRLELLVVSDKQAEVKGMDAWACDNRDLLIPIQIASTEDKETYQDWNSGLYAMAKNGAVWTYLRGEFTPSQMKEDFTASFKPMERFAIEVWDRDAGKLHAFWLFCAWLSVSASVTGLVLICWPKLTEKVFAVGAVAAILVALAGAGAWYSGVQKIETQSKGYSSPIVD